MKTVDKFILPAGILAIALIFLMFALDGKFLLGAVNAGILGCSLALTLWVRNRNNAEGNPKG